MSGWVATGGAMALAVMLWLTVTLAAGLALWSALDGRWGWVVAWGVYAVMASDVAREYMRTMRTAGGDATDD